MIRDEVLVVGNTINEAREFAKQLPKSIAPRCVTPGNIHLMDGVKVSQIYVVDGVHLDDETRHRLAYVYSVGQPRGGVTIMDEMLSHARARYIRTTNNLYDSIDRANEELDNLAELNEALEQLLKVYLAQGRQGERES